MVITLDDIPIRLKWLLFWFVLRGRSMTAPTELQTHFGKSNAKLQ